jgi:hypothetical protein
LVLLVLLLVLLLVVRLWQGAGAGTVAGQERQQQTSRVCVRGGCRSTTETALVGGPAARRTQRLHTSPTHGPEGQHPAVARREEL